MKAGCCAYGLAASGNFSVVRFGEDAASILVREWCRRMTCVDDLALADGCVLGDFQYKAEHTPSVDAGEFTAMLALQP